jgi:hypothetical protein
MNGIQPWAGHRRHFPFAFSLFPWQVDGCPFRSEFRNPLCFKDVSMPRIRGFVVALLALSVAACGAKPQQAQEAIIGRWEAADPKSMVPSLEFAKEGTLRFGVPEGLVLDAKYRWLGDDKLVFEKTLPSLGTTIEETYSVTIKKDALTATDKDGVKHEFKRAK